MDAPQFPDAEASAESAGEQPAGQVSAFRRALDSQVESTEPSTALVPMDPHDHTAPINVAILRTLLASGKPVTADGSPGPDETPTAIAQIPVFPQPTELPIPTLPASTASVPAMTPSASGPTVVMPSVSAPELHAPTTIAETPGPMPAATYPPNAVAATAATTAAAAAAVNRKSARAAATFAGVPVMMNPAEVTVPSPAGGDGSHGDGGDRPSAQEPSPRHNAKPSRLPTAVWISALLGACAGVALVLFNAGHPPDPLPLSALPTKAATHSPSPSPSPSPSLKPSPKPSPSPSLKPSPKPSPSHSPSPSPSPSKPPASPTPSAVASFATIYWTNSPDPRVQDIQQRLTQLNYMFLFDNVAYGDTSRTTGQSGWHTHADPVGMYQNATGMAISAFKYDYLQHDQGPQPDTGCDVATYQALVNATS